MSRWFKKSNRFNLSKMLPGRFYDGEEGAGGGAAASAVADSGDGGAGESVVNLDVPVPEFDTPIPENIRKRMMDNDPDFQDILREEAAAKKEAKKTVNKNTEADLLEDEETVDKGNAGDDKGKKSEPEKKVVDDKNSDTDDPGDDDLEFADNVIEGLKGEHIKKLPREAQIALAEYHEKFTDASEKLTTAEKRLKSLLSDPVIKTREEMIATGKDRYSDYGFTKSERQALAQKWIDKVGLTQEEASQLIDETEAALEKVVEHRTSARFNNQILEENTRRQIDESTSKGRQAFLELGKLNPSLAFKETDANAFWERGTNEKGENVWVLKENHPEIKAYREKILPIMSALSEAGVSYDGVVKMINGKAGIKGLYAFAGTLLNLPVAINTGDRDRKMIASETRKKLSRFLKGNSSGELSIEGGSSIAAKERASKSVMKEGFDILKLAEGDKYYDEAINSKPGNLKHAQRVSELAEEGKAYLKSNKRK